MNRPSFLKMSSASRALSFIISLGLLILGVINLVIFPTWVNNNNDDKETIRIFQMLMSGILIAYALVTSLMLFLFDKKLQVISLVSHGLLGTWIVIVGLLVSNNNNNTYIGSLLKLGSSIVAASSIGLISFITFDNKNTLEAHTDEDTNVDPQQSNNKCFSWCCRWNKNSSDTNNQSIDSNDASVPLLSLQDENEHALNSIGKEMDLECSTNPPEEDPTQKNKEKGGVQRLLLLALPHKFLLILACVVLLIRLPFSVAMPHFVSTTFTFLTNKEYDRAVREIGRMMAVGTVDAALDFWCVYLFGLANLRVTKQLRQNLFQKILSQEMSFFDSANTGELTSRLNADCGQMASDLTWVFRFSIEAIVRVAIIVAYLLVQSPQLGGITISIIPIIAFINQRYGLYLKSNAMAVQEALAEANAVAQETFSCIRTVLSYASEDLEVAKYSKKITAWYDLNRMALIITSCYYMLVCTFLSNTFTQSAILFAGISFIQNGKLTAQVLLSFMLYQGQLQDYTQQLFGSYTTLLRSSGTGDAVFALLDRVPFPPGTGSKEVSYVNASNNGKNSVTPCAGNEEVFSDFKDHGGGQQQSESEIGHQNTVDFECVDFFYPTRPNHIVLSGLSLSISSGLTVALVGHSGCGKSTIVALIERLYDPVQGRVLIGGKDLGKLSLKEHRRNIGIVTQDPILFSGTILSNITYGESSDDSNMLENAKEAARLANAHAFIESFADGYYTQVGERGVQLSGGQKQRIAIARAIFKRPSILLLDEATSALDTESERLVQDALDRLLFNAHGSVTTIVVAHRLQTVRNADVILVLSQGSVAEQGSHNELLQINGGIYRQMIHSSNVDTGLLDANI